MLLCWLFNVVFARPAVSLALLVLPDDLLALKCIPASHDQHDLFHDGQSQKPDASDLILYPAANTARVIQAAAPIRPKRT
ncbi:hypothetical protein EST38_g6047 [Candolleomyces aberdarensis]|uniref:Secreted protein n=1 Tax=Candolleomyces aberdarensis TaxID=2316362 RepID=A0A4V1Q3U5_9AGAR|nr:hypothetical protein EST38_g6047 [Candolleomyces aberdarensis]